MAELANSPRVNSTASEGELGCGGRCGRAMAVFDALDPTLRRHLNYHRRKYCSCYVRRLCTELGDIYVRATVMRTQELPDLERELESLRG
jgi:hypothetical protein